MAIRTEELILNVNKVLGIANNLAVGILNTVLVQNTTAPIIAASNNLRANRPLLSTRLAGQWRQWMLDVLAAGVLWSLDSNQIFIIPKSALHHKPIHIIGTLVLVTLDKVPTQNKVLCNIVDAVANQAHGYVVPRHAPEVSLAQLITLPVLDALEVHDSVVVKVLPREDIIPQASWMHISQRVLVGIPSAEAEVNAANECHSIINHNEFLVVRLIRQFCDLSSPARIEETHPVKSHIGSILKDVVIGMAQHTNITMTRSTLRAKILQCMLGMCRIAGQRLIHLLVDNHINLDTGLCATLQDMIQPPFLVLGRRATEEQLRRQPPIGNVDGLRSLFQSLGDSPQIIQGIDIPLDAIALLNWGEGQVAMRLGNCRALSICGLFMFFVVTVVGIDNIEELAHFVL
jgi:hypothetical protein